MKQDEVLIYPDYPDPLGDGDDSFLWIEVGDGDNDQMRVSRKQAIKIMNTLKEMFEKGDYDPPITNDGYYV